MPLTAKYNNNIINIVDYIGSYDDLRNNIFCTLCGNDFILKNGRVKIKHFAHKKKCNCEHKSESIEHIKTKIFLYKYFKSIVVVNKVELEKSLSSCRPDIYVNTNKSSIGIEVQISYDEDIVKRSIRNFSKDKIYSLWVFIPKKRKWFIGGDGMYIEHADSDGYSIYNNTRIKLRYDLVQKEIDIYNILKGLFIAKNNKLIFLKLSNTYPFKYKFTGDYEDPHGEMYTDFKHPYKKIKLIEGFSVVNYIYLKKHKEYPIIIYDFESDPNYVSLYQ